MWIGIISLFPNMFNAITDYGISSKALKKGIIQLSIWNPRYFAKNKQLTVDDRPYGGGVGMIMKVQPLRDAIHAAKKAAIEETKVIYLSPQGRKLDQKGVKELSERKKIILVCGRYEGIDERLIISEIDEEWSIGDYILTGGEIPAMILIDAMIRLIPGVLGNISSVKDESFSKKGLLEYPQFTRPKILAGKKVPSVLLSGNHANIRRWRLKQSLARTLMRRPDIFNNIIFNKEELILLEELKQECYNEI
ncbi:MAG: tRNA (guanosine(37)-N1)-methyltransferase TrmD [Candidatus Dasytiphilus stammeri]